ncbi:MAG TPA: sulfite exporter TauE/SafE family protein [Gaiellales bacterium]|nr:sulfite exporter TauE/SafE family protein [Gaiellales bacterium]
MSHDVLAAALGLLAGTLSALFGVGGGVVFVPTLIFLGASARVAVATSLAAMVPVVLMGSWRQTRYGSVTWRDAAIIGVASVPTAKLGEIVADSLPNDTLQRLFAVVLVVTAVQLAVRALRESPTAE